MVAATPPPGNRPLQHQLRSHGEASLDQGDLDGLCGLYAAINGLRLLLAPVRQLERHEAKKLFDAGVAFLADHDMLDRAVKDGFDNELWRLLVQRVVVEASALTQHTIVAQQPLAEVARPSRSATFHAIEAAVSVGQPVLVDLSGAHDHFTVISGYSPYSLFLYDSGALYWLTRKSCSTANAHTSRHYLNPHSLTVLSLEG